MSQKVHHEVELVAIIGRGGRHIAVTEALHHVDSSAVGLDMTARDLQAMAKKKGRPWSVSKGFDTFAPMGAPVAARDVGSPRDMTLTLFVNGEQRQCGQTCDMLFDVAQLVAYCSQIFTLQEGDLIFTGTPHGVGPVKDGDTLVATCTGLVPLTVHVRREDHP